MSESGVELADDYTKRKHVFRLKTQSASEVLFQAENDTHLGQWIEKLEPLAASVLMSQPNPAHSSATVVTTTTSVSSTGRKLTSARNRSPTGQSPATKNRKPSAGMKNKTETFILNIFKTGLKLVDKTNYRRYRPKWI